MTNDQIPITREKDNNQFTNNQTDDQDKRARRFIRRLPLFWSLVIIFFFGYCDLGIGYYLFRRFEFPGIAYTAFSSRL